VRSSNIGRNHGDSCSTCLGDGISSRPLRSVHCQKPTSCQPPRLKPASTSWPTWMNPLLVQPHARVVGQGDHCDGAEPLAAQTVEQLGVKSVAHSATMP